jgi:hypothetical protein
MFIFIHLFFTNILSSAYSTVNTQFHTLKRFAIKIHMPKNRFLLQEQKISLKQKSMILVSCNASEIKSGFLFADNFLHLFELIIGIHKLNFYLL